MPIILVIDDKKQEQDDIVDQLKRRLGTGVSVVPFTADNEPTEGASYEHHIAEWIESNLDTGELSLIACDKELGLYKNLRGLSATPVASVASDRGIPFCLYSRQPDDTGRDFAKYQRLRRWSSDEITLDGTGTEKWAQQITSLFQGFRYIAERFAEVDKNKTPPAALAEILNHPEAESRIALYGSGDQSFLMETLAFIDQEEPDQLRKRMPRVLGNWLRLSILRFPGILVNSIAGRSYLNLDEESFADERIRSKLNPAKYSGPFCELDDWWWREDLDRILEEESVADGLELAIKVGIAAQPCLDEQTKKKAGFYCMITQAPVSSENSRSGISWFPSGADLARIRKDKFERITALVGLY